MRISALILAIVLVLSLLALALLQGGVSASPGLKPDSAAFTNSYDPPDYGLPPMIAGYRTFAVPTSDNTACMRAGERRLVLQAMLPGVQEFLKSANGTSVSCFTSEPKGGGSGGLGKLAYISEGNLWVRTLPDGAAKQLTSGGGNSSPRWSPSGEWVALRRGDGRIWVMRDTGESATGLKDIDTAGMHAWSPVTDTLAFTTQGNLSVASAPDWRSQSVIAVQAPFSWSPDGEWLAFSQIQRLGPLQEGQVPPRYAAIYKVRADGRDRRELLNAGNPSDDGLVAAGWSRDGSEFYYFPDPMFSASLLADGSELRAVSTDGSLVTKRVAPSMLLHPDFWSEASDGKHLAVSAGVGRETWSHKRIAIVDRPSGHLTYLTESNIAAFSPAWSPDGERLAYVAAPDIGFVGGGPPAKAGAAERRIWIMNQDGSNQHALTNDSTYRDEFPQWSRDGQSILFVRLNAADEASVWLVSSSGGAPQQVAGALDLLTSWFGYYGYIDWSKQFDWWIGESGGR